MISMTPVKDQLSSLSGHSLLSCLIVGRVCCLGEPLVSVVTLVLHMVCL